MATAQSSGGGTMLVKVITEGPQGPPGPVGQGFASGGTTGQVLAKASNDDYDTEWLTVGGTGTVTSVGIVPASGMVVSGSPITAAGDITLSYDSGFQAYTTAEANKLASVASGAQVNEATNLSYTASSRLLDSSTGSGITLPLFSSTEPGLVGQSGGGTVNFLRADGAWAEPPGGGGGGSGTVTSVALSVPSGFAVAGSPVTTSGTIALGFDTGYSLPTNTKQGQWDTAYSERLYWDGGATGLNAITARVSLELGNAATLNVGTTAGTVLAGDALSVHTAAADPHPNYALESSLATVATTGSYADLTNKPVIPSGADATPQPLGVAAIGASSDYAREDHIHAMPSAGDVGADPAGTSASGISAHEAAADPHPSYALESNLATVATTGAYSDLSGLPALGTAAALNTGTTSGTVATGDRGLPTGGTTGQVLQKTSGTDYDADWETLSTADIYVIACSDETTALTTGTGKITFRMPSAGTLTAVKATVTTAPVGSALIVDINEAGTTLLSTKLSIDDGEKTSSTAATPAVISNPALADDRRITIDIDQVGSGTAGAGLKVTLYVTRG